MPVTAATPGASLADGSDLALVESSRRPFRLDDDPTRKDDVAAPEPGRTGGAVGARVIRLRFDPNFFVGRSRPLMVFYFCVFGSLSALSR